MVSLQVDNVALKYPLPRTFHLGRRPVHDNDSRIGGEVGIGPDGRKYVTALDGVSFTLKPGDRLGLLGPNGAGKTTLLKLLYGIYKPTSGRVIREGRVDALFNINLGFRFDVSGRRNIVLRGLINGWTRKQIDERMEQIIEFSQLGDFIDMEFGSYSQGMAARLAFAIATNFDPEILLMDEWIGAGDAEFALQAKGRMEEIVSRAGIIVLASHNAELLHRVCNKALWLNKGRIHVFAEDSETFNRYIELPTSTPSDAVTYELPETAKPAAANTP